MLFLLTGCSKTNATDESKSILYSGHGDSWLVTYTNTNVGIYNYASLTVQYLFVDSYMGQPKEVGPIDYVLEGENIKIESSFPQELQGNNCFQTGTISNSNYIDMDMDGDMNISIKWQNLQEDILLVRQN